MRDFDEDLLPKIRARFVDSAGLVEKGHNISQSGVPDSNVKESQHAREFSEAGALEPPYDPNVLCGLFEHSNALRPNVDAYVTNIDAFGHRFDPIIDLQDRDANEQISDAIYLERLHEAGDPDDLESVPLPTDSEVEARRKTLALQMRLEKSKLENFFDFCCADDSFIKLRRKMRQDLEVLGNAYWEVLRNDKDEPAQFTYLPSFTVRITPLDREVVEVERRHRITPITFEMATMNKRFRRYVQVFGGHAIFFKEFGDPRVISAKTGKAYETPEQLQEEEENPNAREATEIIHFSIHNPESSYGVPRWIGVLLSVLGSRQAEEVNFLYFDNKSVPPLAIIVSGGRISGDSVTRIQDFIQNNIKGRKNFHSVMILEAETGGKGGTQSGSENAGKAKIELKPLTGGIHNDALFQKYDERNIDKIGMSFRLPRMLRGDIRDFNRACYSEDTETLTQSGWKLHTEIGPDEKIAAFSPSDGAIKFVVPAGKHVHTVDEDMIRFANSHTDCLVTVDHKMLARSAQTRKIDPEWEEFEAAKIPYDRFEMPMAASTWSGKEIGSWQLPKTAGCKIERGHDHSSQIDFDDWLEFLGYFISEGGLLTTNHPSAPYLVYIDQKKPVIRDRIAACLNRLGWKYSTQEKPCGTTHFLFSNRCLRDWLITNVGTNSYDWRIPDGYLDLGVRQLRILFDAMMDGDGSIDRRENRTSAAYYTASPVLAGQVQRLLIQIGKRATVGQGDRCLRVMFCDRNTTQLVAAGSGCTPPSVSRIRYRGDVYCYSVPGYGFFVTRRNGKVAIQGNTADAALNFAEMQVFQPEREDFDFVINRRILLQEFGIRFWSFTSNAPVTRNPKEMAEIIRNLANANVLWPQLGATLAQDVFNKKFPIPNEDWAKQPIPLTIAGVPVNGDLTEEGMAARAESEAAAQAAAQPSPEPQKEADPVSAAKAIKAVMAVYHAMQDGDEDRVKKALLDAKHRAGELDDATFERLSEVIMAAK